MVRSLRRGLVAFSLASVILLAVPLVALAAPGDLDSTFSGDGMQTTDLGFSTEGGNAVVGLSGGKLLVLGDSGDDIGLVRYGNDGLPDPAFGGGDGIVKATLLGSEDSFNGLAVLSSGKIVVAAETEGSGHGRLGLFRFTATGAPDSTFGGGDGKLTVDFGHEFSAYDLVVLGNGKLLVSGELEVTNANSVFLVTRLRPGGTLDSTFGGGDGFVTTQFRTGGDGAWRMVVDSEGRIVVAGWSEKGANANAYDVALARYSPAGKLDKTFSGDGKVITQIGEGSDDWAAGLARQGTKIVVGAFTDDGDVEHFGILRYLTNGSLDSTFGGGDGTVITPGSNSRQVADVAVDSTGRIVVAGDQGVPTPQFVVARYLANGKVDQGFGTNGASISNFAAGTSASGMTLATGGKIVVVGRSGNDFGVARFLP
jgi:uncharacterized delta-60 repeat protein